MLLKRLLSFLYPSRCLYCTQPLADSFLLLCSSCISTLHFAYHPDQAENIYCFEQHSAASSLIKSFETTSFSKLKELLSSLMTVQYLRYQDHMPDWVIPALQKNSLGQNPVNEALASSFAQRVKGKTMSAFKWSLEPSVYDREGNLKAQLILKHKALTTIRKEESVLILSDYYENPDGYRNVLLKHGYEQVTYLSLVFHSVSCS